MTAEEHSMYKKQNESEEFGLIKKQKFLSFFFSNDSNNKKEFSFLTLYCFFHSIPFNFIQFHHIPSIDKHLNAPTTLISFTKNTHFIYQKPCTPCRQQIHRSPISGYTSPSFFVCGKLTKRFFLYKIRLPAPSSVRRLLRSYRNQS